jgi:hypothetical protein
MPSTLCEAVARCHLRRLRGIAASAPLPGAVFALVIAAAPFVLFGLGGAVGAEVADSVGSTTVAEGLVLGPVLAAAVAGATLAVVAPARSALGNQIAAGPAGAVAAVVALVVVPVTAGSVLVVPSLVAVCAGLAGALPGGMVPGLALAAATLAAVPAGAVVAEAALGACRGQHRRALAVLAGALGWVAVGLALGSVPLGPLAPVPTALRDAGSPWLALAVSCAVSIGLAAGWVALAATRAAPRPRRRAIGRSARRRLPVPLAAVVLLARRADVRLATVGAIAFGLAGAALAAATDAPPPAPFLLGTTTALLGSLLCPLVVGGMLDDGRWIWRSAPVRGGAISRSFALSSTAVAALAVTVVGGVALVASGGDAATVGVVGALVIIGSGVALVAGAVVPWRSEGAGDQMTTIAAFAGITIGASLVVGLLAPRLVALGSPDPVILSAVCIVSLLAGIAALERRVGAASR